ncbi:MAG: hypothetical protein ACRDQ7_08285 [Haloechinothrix sp.]
MVLQQLAQQLAALGVQLVFQLGVLQLGGPEARSSPLSPAGGSTSSQM